MIFNFLTILIITLSGSYIDSFYINKIENGVKEYVLDEDRKAELKKVFSSYDATMSAFNKKEKLNLDELKKKNLDKKTPSVWYDNQMEVLLVERKTLQSVVINLRLQMGTLINDDEWGQIMELADKDSEEDRAKEVKLVEESKNEYIKLEQHIEITIEEKLNRIFVLDALDVYKVQELDRIRAYQRVNTSQETSLVLREKDVSKEELEALAKRLIDYRKNNYLSYIDFISLLAENTTSEEYTSIMKKFNKSLN